jgi:DnaJ-class molecular chaperone
MNRACAFQVLNLNSDASPEDIRKAYKRRALETHPDKLMNGDDSLFKEVATAYAVLSGQTSHMDEAINIFTPEFLAQVLQSIISVMREKSNNTGNTGNTNIPCESQKTSQSQSQSQSQSNTKKTKRTERRKPKSIHVDMKVTIEDLYKARIKKLVIKVKRVKDTSTHTLYISLLNYQPIYKFNGVGDEHVEGGVRGNIIVYVSIEPDDIAHVDDIICKHDLYVDVKISLWDYYTTSTYDLMLWDTVKVQVPYSTGQKCSVVEDKGLPWYDESTETECRGAMYVYFELTLPETPPPLEALAHFQKLNVEYLPN